LLIVSIPIFTPLPWRERIKERGITPTLIFPLTGEEFNGGFVS